MVNLNMINDGKKSVCISKPRKRTEADKQRRRESEMAKMKNRKTENLEHGFYKKLLLARGAFSVTTLQQV